MSHFNINMKQSAILHTGEMQEQYSEEIKESIANSKIYRNKVSMMDSVAEGYNSSEKKTPFIIVANMLSDEAVIKYGDENTTLLNFASFKYPGGGFIMGSIAQEEAICHKSNLFNIINDNKFAEDYEWNRTHLNYSLYHNFGIFSPKVIFPVDQQEYPDNPYKYIHCNVLTCAAPNTKAYRNNDVYGGSDEIVQTVLSDRIKFILDICQLNNQKTLILGAFGCGVFGNDPEMVAQIFNEHLNSGKYSFEKVIYAIPAGKNLEAFKKVIKSKEYVS